MTDTEKLEIALRFIRRVGDNYTELSHDKVRYEYLYFKKRAREILDEIT